MENQTIGNFKIVREIGRGGMGVVYLAEHINLQKQIAVKCLAPEFSKSSELRERFSNEAKSLARIEHQNIVQIFDYYEYESNFYLTMEYFPGKGLDQLLLDKGPMEEHVALSIFTDVLQGLNYAHTMGVIHRDIKPSNILVNNDNNAKIIDFGIAIIANNERLTSTGSATIGTPHYMSPEQIQTPKTIDHRTDVYSMGIILYEMLTGILPFDSEDSDYHIKEQHITKMLPTEPLLQRNIPKELISIIKKSLEKKPDKRFNGCGEFYQYLNSYMDSNDKKSRPRIISCQSCHTKFRINSDKSLVSLQNKRCPKCNQYLLQPADTSDDTIETNQDEKTINTPIVNQDNITDTFKHKTYDLFFLCLLGAIFISPFVFIKGIYDYANLPQSFFIQTGCLLLLIIFLVKETLKGSLQIQLSPLHKPLIIFFAWIWLTLFWSINKYESFVINVHWAACILTFFLIFNSVNHRKQCLKILNIIFFSALLVSMIGITQHLFDFSWIPQTLKPSATFANKEMAIHFITLTFPIGIGLFFYTSNQYKLLYYSFACSVAFVYTVYTSSWLAVISFIIQCISWAILLFIDRLANNSTLLKWNKKTKFILAFSILFTLVMIHLTPGGFDWTIPTYKNTLIKDAFEEKNSIVTRAAIYINSLQVIMEHFILGVGSGNFKIHYPLYHKAFIPDNTFSEGTQLTHLHNDFLQMWSELGTIGLLIMIMIIFVSIKMIIRLIYLEKTEFRFLIMGILVSIIGFFVNASFSFPMYRSLPPFILCIYLGLISLVYVKIIHTKAKTIMINQRIFTGGLAFILFGFLITWSSVEFNWLLSDKFYHKMDSAEKSKLWEASIAESNKAILHNPYRKKIYSYMGRAYVESGQNEKAIEAILKCLDVYPNHMNAWINLGVAYGNTNNYDQALNCYKKVIKIKEDYAKPYNNMANIYMKQDKIDDAYEFFNLAATYDEKNPVIFFNIGIVALQKKAYNEAKDAFQKAIDLKPDWAMAYKNLGVVLYQYLDQKKEGVYYFKEALKRDPFIKDYAQMQNIIDSVEQNYP